jgi:hypothetical protein
MVYLSLVFKPFWIVMRADDKTAILSRREPRVLSATPRDYATDAVKISDRVRTVLSAIFDSGELRIRDVTPAVSVPHQSINALMQYLKRKRLVKKSGRELNSPYALTAERIAALTEMTRNSDIRRQGECIGRR